MNDVIVVGGGPVGSYVAKRLAGMGYGVEVLEKGTKNNKKVCCTGIIGKKCYQTFFADKDIILKNGRSAVVYSPSGNVLHLKREEDQAYIIDRSDLDSKMASDAIAAGAEYIENCLVRKIAIHKNCAEVEYVKDGKILKPCTKTVVMATGFGSRLLSEIGVGKSGYYTVGAQIEVKHRDIDEIEIYAGHNVAPGHFGWLVPLDSKRALVGLMTRKTPGLYLKNFLSFLKDKGKIDVNGESPSYRGITLQPPKRTYGERFVVVGDAAGQVKPLTGGGLYFGLIGAEIAVNNIDKALTENDFRADMLANYEKEWKSILGRDINICRLTHRLYTRLSDRQMDKIFNITTNKGIDKGLLESGELDFDFHSKIIRKAIGFQTISKIFSR